MRLIIDPHILSSAFLPPENPDYRSFTNEIVELLDTLASCPTVQPEMSARIFISYKSADYGRADSIYRFLTANGHIVWFDKRSLTVGDAWWPEIEKAIRQYDLFLACFSADSVHDEGDHHREYEVARERSLRMPEGRKFIIPVRLNDVKIPEKFQHLQVLDLHRQGGYGDLLNAIATEINSWRGRTTPQGEPASISLRLCEDKATGETKVFRRYKALLEISKDFGEWIKILRQYGAFDRWQVEDCLSPIDKDTLRKFDCRDLEDEIFVQVACIARADLVSEGGPSGECRQKHKRENCDTIRYLRETMKIVVRGLNETRACLSDFKANIKC